MSGIGILPHYTFFFYSILILLKIIDKNVPTTVGARILNVFGIWMVDDVRCMVPGPFEIRTMASLGRFIYLFIYLFGANKGKNVVQMKIFV